MGTQSEPGWAAGGGDTRYRRLLMVIVRFFPTPTGTRHVGSTEREMHPPSSETEPAAGVVGVVVLVVEIEIEAARAAKQEVVLVLVLVVLAEESCTSQWMVPTGPCCGGAPGEALLSTTAAAAAGAPAEEPDSHQAATGQPNIRGSELPRVA